MTEVALVRCAGYENASVSIKNALELIGGLRSMISPGQKVLLKPNLCDPLAAEKAATTHPLFVKAVIEIVKEITPKVVVAEQAASTIRETTAKAVDIAGIGNVLAETRTIFRDMANEDFIPYDIPEYRILERTDFAKVLTEADVIINLPKLKTHGITYITGAVKNMFGCIHPDERQYLHREFPDRNDFCQGIIDVYSFFKPHLTIMDAVTAMEGDEGPSYGDPVDLGFVIVSRDGVALDAVAARLTGHNPRSILTSTLAAERGIGEADMTKIKVLGEPLEIMQFNVHANYKTRHDGLAGVQPAIDQSLCKKCGACYKNCPADAIEVNDGVFRIIKEKCIKCYCCVENCIYAAITLTSGSGADLIRLGLSCNQACVFCTAYSRTADDLSGDEVKKEMDFLAKKGCGTLALTGGEPTIRKDLKELVGYAKAIGIKKVEIQTNGVALAKKNAALELVQAGVDHFFISIHSHDPKIYKELTTTPALKKALMGVENALQAGASVQICHVINRKNVLQVKEFASFIKDRFDDRVSLYFGFVRPKKELENGKDIIPRLTEAELSLYHAFRFCDENNLYFEVEGMPLCYMQGFEERNIESKRMLGPSVFHLEKGVKRSDTHSLHLDQNKAEGEVCKVCILREVCPKVWKEYADLYGTSELFPIFDETIKKKIIK